MNRTGIFNRKKGVNDEKAMDTFVEKLEDKVWVGVVENAVTDCLEQSETRRASFEADTKQLQKRFKNDRICSPAAGFIMECVHVSVYKVKLITNKKTIFFTNWSSTSRTVRIKSLRKMRLNALKS